MIDKPVNKLPTFNPNSQEIFFSGKYKAHKRVVAEFSFIILLSF